MTTFAIVLSIFVMLLSLISFGLSIFLLFKLGQEKGIGHAVLGFLFFPYPYIWGWINVKRLQIMDVMLALTFMMVISFIAPIVMVAAMTTAGLQSLAQQSNQSGTFISSNESNGNISFSSNDFQTKEQSGTYLVTQDGKTSFSSRNPIEMGAITLGGQVSGSFDDGFDMYDWTFQGTAGQQITIRCDGTGKLKPEIKLVYGETDWVATSEVGASDKNVHITNFTLAQDGTYTIRLSPEGLDGGQYTASLN